MSVRKLQIIAELRPFQSLELLEYNTVAEKKTNNIQQGGKEGIERKKRLTIRQRIMLARRQ